MPYGPCIVCGKTNYPNSMGGPGICPSCDCGITPQRDPVNPAMWPAPIFSPQGCICPPTSEQTCKNPACPRGGQMPFTVT